MKTIKKIMQGWWWLLQGLCHECGAELEPPYSSKQQHCVKGHKV